MIIADPERALSIAYAPAASRAALAVLWRLDERLGAVVANTREDRLGAIRLAWWREALERLDVASAPDEPLLRDIAGRLIGHGLAGAELSGLTEGWSALLVPAPLDDDAVGAHADERGARLFALAGRLLGAQPPELAAAGAGWALVDLAFHVRDPASAERAMLHAAERFAPIRGWRWPARLRSLGAVATLAADDAGRGWGAPRVPGSPRRVARMLRHRLIGC